MLRGDVRVGIYHTCRHDHLQQRERERERERERNIFLPLYY